MSAKIAAAVKDAAPLRHLRVPRDKVKPDQPHCWRWWEAADKTTWATYWDGGALVDFYGPFIKAAA
jgi:hypothetical protein